MSVGDLKNIIARATPRVEDNRAPDRCDFIRKEFGHSNFREVINALSGLGFSRLSFMNAMKEHLGTKYDIKAAPESGVHALYRVLLELEFLEEDNAFGASAATDSQSKDDNATPVGSAEMAEQAKAEGTEKFKAQDFVGAVKAYTTAIESWPLGSEGLHLVYGNRSMARLKLIGKDASNASPALSDAAKAVEICPEWPKGYFRKGQALKALEQFDEAIETFRRGQKLEPANADWAKEIERCIADQVKSPRESLRQFIMMVLPEVLSAWVQGLKALPAGESPMLVVAQPTPQGPDVLALGSPPDSASGSSNLPKAQLRYAFMSRKIFMANYLSGLSGAAAAAQDPNAPAALLPSDLLGCKPPPAHKVTAFLDCAEAKGACNIAVEVPVKSAEGGSLKSARAFFYLPYDAAFLTPFIPPLPEPLPPKGAVDGVLEIQKKTGFPRGLPWLLGFQNFESKVLQFPVINLFRDAPNLASSN